jgi:hypothetical protein
MSETGPNSERRQIGPSRVLFYLIALLPLSFCGIVLTFVIWRIHLGNETNRRLHAIRAAGLPTSGEQLNDYYAAVPDKENAALIMTQAFALMRTFPDQRSNQVNELVSAFPHRGQQLSSDERKLVVDYLEMNSNAIEMARAGVAKPHCRYACVPGDREGLLDHLALLKHLAWLAVWQSALYAEEGHGDKAVSDIHLVLGLAGTLDREPIIISQLVRNALVQIAAGGLEQVLNRTSLDEDSMRELERTFAGAVGTNSLALALIGERAAIISYDFQDLAWMPTDRVSQLTLPAIRASGLFGRDLQFYLDATETNLAFAALGPPETLKLHDIDEQLSLLAQSNGLGFSRGPVRNLSGLSGKDALGYARTRLARTALAVERFRLTHGRLPSGLRELILEFLPAVLVDPFDGKPLRYRVQPKGYVIYSVGGDGHDDGGRERPHWSPTNSAVFMGGILEPATGLPVTNGLHPILPPVAAPTVTNRIAQLLIREERQATYNARNSTNTYDITFIVDR